jgi:hypothetical protein
MPTLQEKAPCSGKNTALSKNQSTAEHTTSASNVNTKISCFADAFSTRPHDKSVDEVLRAIRDGGKDGKLKQAIAQIRNQFEAELAITGDIKKAKEAVYTLKTQLPAVAWSGTFTKRANEALIQYIGLLCADLDDLGERLSEVRARLEGDPRVLAVFLSATGNGLKALFRVLDDPSKHLASLRAVEKLVLELTGVQIDPACKDISRLCFMPYDPELYYNPDAIEIVPLPEPEKPKRVTGGEIPADLPLRERITTEELGSLTWSTEKGGYFCTCPGEHLHTNGTAEKHTIVYLDGSPTLDCQHTSCRRTVEAFNTQLRSRIGKAERAAKTGAVPCGNGSKPSLIQLSTVAMLPIVFVYKPLFQANAFHLLVGKKNAGKGVFLSALAARFTRGELGEKRNVIWVAAGEDSLGLDVHPRISLAGGDAARVWCPNVIPKLPADVPLLREWIAEKGNVGLVILDPMSGTLGVGTNTNHDVDVRVAISPLNELADTEKCLIIGVRHLGKGASEKGALESVLGSSDWVNIPRAVLAMALDNEDENIRHIQVVAGNRLPRGSASRSFRIEGVHVVEGGEPVAKAVFIDGAGRDVDEVLRAEPGESVTKSRRAKMELLSRLEASDTGFEPDSLSAEIAAETGISASTIRNAKTWLKKNGLIYFKPDKDEAGIVRGWQVLRTKAPRPAELQESHSTNPVGSVEATQQEVSTEPQATQQVQEVVSMPLNKHSYGSKTLLSGCLVDGEWMVSGGCVDATQQDFDTQGEPCSVDSHGVKKEDISAPPGSVDTVDSVDTKDPKWGQLIEFIGKRGGAVTVREVMRSYWPLRNQKEKAEAVLSLLVSTQLGEWEETPTTAKGGHPTRVFRLLLPARFYRKEWWRDAKPPKPVAGLISLADMAQREGWFIDQEWSKRVLAEDARKRKDRLAHHTPLSLDEQREMAAMLERELN